MKRLGQGFLALVAGWAMWRVLGPDRRPRVVGPQTRPVEIPGRTVFVAGRELFVRVAGPTSAPPLVLLHGIGFDGEMTYHRLLPGLVDRYRVVVPDYRGHGKSDRVRGRHEIADVADDVAGVLDALGIERATVFGYSMGGMVGLALADRHPTRVDRLVLAATAAYPFDRMRGVARLLAWGVRGVTRLSVADQAAANYHFLRRAGILEPRHGRWLWDALMSRDATLYWEAAAAIWRFDGRTEAARLRMPVLQIVTGSDQVVRPRLQRALTAALTEPRVIELSRAGHEAILADPEPFAHAIDEFVGSIDRVAAVGD